MNLAQDPDLMFRLSNGLALLAWLGLIASPPSAPWAARTWWLAGRAVPALLSSAYVLLMVTQWRGEGGFGSVEAVRALFDVPGVLVAGWIHYLAFDLFVGVWIASRCADMGWRHLWVVPLLLLTFMLGPVGLLTFMGLRVLRRQTRTDTPTGGTL